ncbi:M64 family metallopeptidase [Tamlana sp. 2_MG-2023]|uniref:T9SS type A sorting domain-containing protein n=1 Tax=unclassified Tamlana TaxID=2614803 RepID=UPI0026E3C9FE|nr:MULTISPECIES: M64 family metallopeptidase [unclassified Tamlana]MDO6760876.1 M64 family metallopeptidase [Tamlana sp. 2_MG-2023]MDO6791132.1 M64 family metallopeptidase [Tamlana sp. 1_MG-2023]
MKIYFSLIISILISTLVLHGQNFPLEAIKISGNDDKKINIVFLSEGYQASEMDKFLANATSFTNTFFNTSPFREYADYFNVYALKVPSNESGADHPGTATDLTEPAHPISDVDTYFNATYDAYNRHRLLYYEIDGNAANDTETKIINVLADNFPMYDQGLVLVNSSHYGGSGGDFPVTYNGYWGPYVAMHEIGHSLFNLLDEYYPGDDLAREGINMTQETDPTQVRWKNWYNVNKAGVHQHYSETTPKDWYKPNKGTCIMESVDKPFCSVCKEGIIEKIHELTNPIDSYSPNNTTVDAENFPIEFELQLTTPNPNTLKNRWNLNAFEFATDMESVFITEADLLKGTNALTVVVTDDSNLLMIDNHERVHAYIANWTINYSTLGITDIESVVDKLHISMFPNPANTIINFEFEGNNDTPLTVDIISMDGKRVQTLTVSNLEPLQIDISHLNSGIYLTNFYSGNTLISSKRLVIN